LASAAKIEHPKFDELGCVKQDFSVSRTLQDVPDPEIAEKRAIIERLRAHFTRHNLAGLLASAVIKIQDGNVSIASARLGYMTLRMIESPHVPMSPLEIICLGKYGTFKTAEFNFPPPEFEI
jgi:hypothetical protein